jgi:hypothetical protein
LINGCALDSCFRLGSSCEDQRISPLTKQSDCPRTPLLTADTRASPLWGTGPVRLCHAEPCRNQVVCLDHAGLIMVDGVTGQDTTPRRRKRPCPIPGRSLGTPMTRLTAAHLHSPPDAPRGASQGPDPVSDDLLPTTSVLTATTLTYAIRAGITAGAGTRLVL